MTPRDDRDGRGIEPWAADDGRGRYPDHVLDLDEDWTEEDERRYQERRLQERKRVSRRRRQSAAFAVLVLAVMGVGLTAAGVYQGWWNWPVVGAEGDAASPTAQPCPTPTVTAAAPAEVSVRVLNSTDRSGLAGAVAAELQARGFTVSYIGNDADDVTVAEAAAVRHGPEGLMAARTAAAQIRGAVLVDDGRPGAEVEVSLGDGFVDMLPPPEAAALLAPAPVESPAGCVPATTPADTATGTPTTS